MSNHDHIKFYTVSLLLTVDTRGQRAGGSPVDFIEVPDGCPAEILSFGYEPRCFDEPDKSRWTACRSGLLGPGDHSDEKHDC